MRISCHHTRTKAIQWQEGCAGPSSHRGSLEVHMILWIEGLWSSVTKYMGFGITPGSVLGQGPRKHTTSFQPQLPPLWCGNRDTSLGGQLSQEMNVEFSPWFLAHSKCSIKVWAPWHKSQLCPGQVAQSVGALSCTPKCCGFDSRSGHMGTYLGYRFNPWLGHIMKVADRCFSFKSMFLLLPSPTPIPTPISLKSIKTCLPVRIFKNIISEL